MGSEEHKSNMEHVREALSKHCVKDSVGTISALNDCDRSGRDERVTPWHICSNLQELGVRQHQLINVQLWCDQGSSQDDVVYQYATNKNKKSSKRKTQLSS